MVDSYSFIDSVITDSVIIGESGGASGQLPSIDYPPYTAQYLRDFLAHLLEVSAGEPAALLPAVTEASLYTLAVALRAVASDGDAPLKADANLRDALAAELRWRNCKTMGADPRGPVRRGRLAQLTASCATLTRAGVSSAQRHNLAGDCPFCGSADFRVFLASVRWRCFACDRQGGVLEFAVCLAEGGAG